MIFHVNYEFKEAAKKFYNRFQTKVLEEIRIEIEELGLEDGESYTL